MSSDLVRFGELFLTPQKNGLTRPKKVRGSGVPMVNMGELFAHPRIRNLVMDRVPLAAAEAGFVLAPGDLLFARQSLVLAGAGQCSVFLGSTEPTTFESHLIRCRIDPKRADPIFYFYFFRSQDGRRTIEAIVEQGAGASGIRGSDLVNVQVPCPPLSVQQQVGMVLSALDDRVALLNETNATLETIAQALFKSWFVDFDPVRAKSQGLAPAGMDEATAALFPPSQDEWRRQSSKPAVSELIDAGTLAIGDGYRAKNDELGLPGLPFVRAGDLDAGQITPTKDYLSDRSARAAAAKIAKPGDTAFTSKGTIGRFAYVDADAGEAVYSPQVCFWRSLRHDIVDPIYLHYWMKSDAFKAQVDMVRGQAAIMDYVSLGDQRRMRLDVPPVRLQSHFADVVRVLLTRISCNRGLAADLASARDMLLPRLVSGQLRLPDTANADSAQA